MGKGELLRESVKNLEFLKNNYSKLEKTYDKRWIVIENGAVTNSSSTYEEIMKTKVANKKTALFEFIDSEPIALFF